MNEGKKRKKERKEKKEEWKGGWSVKLPATAGGGRRWSEMAGSGRRWPEKVAKSPSPNQWWSASVVQKGEMEFRKRGFGERSYTSLERVFRGEKDGVIRGG